MVLREPVRLGLLANYTLTPGIYLKTGDKKGAAFYRPDTSSGAGIVKSLLADPPQAVRLTDKDKICVVTIFNAMLCEGGANFTRKKVEIANPENFQQTLIYSGRVANRIKISYRETSDSLARPAFNNEAEYDLSESMTIAYKGARLEIIEATNEFLKYRVLQNFNAARE
jgi:hypothetical protein